MNKFWWALSCNEGTWETLGRATSRERAKSICEQHANGASIPWYDSREYSGSRYVSGRLYHVGLSPNPIV